MAPSSRGDEVRQDPPCPVNGRGFVAAGHASHGWSAAWRLPPDASSAGIARSLLLTALTAPEPSADFVDAALMVTSELAANAITHAVASRPPELWLHLAHSPAPRLVVSVFDTDRHHLPSLTDPTEFEETGRGLRIVAAVSAEWGTRLTRSRLDPSRAGKAVWAALVFPADWAPAPLMAPQPTPYTAAELLHTALTARGIDHVYRQSDDRLQVISIRSGLTVWVGETFTWQDDDGHYVHHPLGDVADITERLVERYEHLAHHAVTR